MAGFVDGAFAAAIEARARRERLGDLAHAQRMAALAEIEAAYGGERALADRAFFAEPKALSLRRGAEQIRARTWEIAWASDFRTHLEAVADRYSAHVENRTARARVYLAGRPEEKTTRPAVIAVHGYMGGHWLFEEAQWPIDWFLRRGLDVALPVLPMHAVRGGAHRGGPTFPSADPRITIEGFRQAIGDLRTLAGALRERGASHVGVIGMSLGGYTAALLATVAPEIDFVMPLIPLASLADFAREQGRLGSGPEAEAEHAAIERVHWVVSPLARPLLVPRERALVMAALRDRITPVSHAERIVRHFGCDLVTIEGGHLLQVGRSEAFRAFGALLERAGILAPRR